LAVAIAIWALTVSSFSNNADGSNQIVEREKKIIKFFEKLEPGSNPDYAIVKYGIMGKNPTIIVYGYRDNREVCKDIVEMFDKAEKDALVGDYRCEPLD
jgi:hypothetical protein